MIPKAFLNGPVTLTVCTKCERIKKFAVWTKPSLGDLLKIQDAEKEGKVTILEETCQDCIEAEATLGLV